DTWRALENVAALVGERGALFLYLYGSESWDREQQDEIVRVREELASLSFEDKIEELKRRFPGDDPHQLFDLMSPVINDRLAFDDVAGRLRALGFSRIERTISSGEIFLRAARPGFPDEACLPAVLGRNSFSTENDRRWALRRGAAFETS